VTDNKDEFFHSTMTGKGVFFNQPKYDCPKHGVTEHTIAVSIEGYEGDYCMVCAIEKMIESGVHKVTPHKPQP